MTNKITTNLDDLLHQRRAESKRIEYKRGRNPDGLIRTLYALVNDLDIRAVEKAVAYLDRVSFESLPILPTGVCVLAGVSAQVPVMVKMAELDGKFEPNSRTMSVTDAWLRPTDDMADSEPGHA